MSISDGISEFRRAKTGAGGHILPPWLRRILAMPRSVRVTREGKWYIAAVLVTGGIAINTGNNLLYLVLATLLSIIILSGIMSELTMRGLVVTRRLPRRLYRDSSFTTSIEIVNEKRIIPSICFRIYELPAEGLPDTHSYVVKVSAGERRTLTVSSTVTRRGLINLRGFKITTTFPFGLFLKSRILKSPDKVLVYPRIKPVDEARLTESIISRSGVSLNARGSGTGLYNIREYTQNDDARHIHWKSAARVENLMIMEFEQETDRSVVVSFKNLSEEGMDDLFEDKVDEAAGTVKYFIDKGWSVGLDTLSGSLADSRGEAHLYRILEFLALIRPAGRGTPSIKVL